jgi:hypothetical protein
MDILKRIATLSSPFPLVDLDLPHVPVNGLHHPTPKFCHKVFRHGECERFYRGLDRAAGRQQCPYGFSVWPARIGPSRVAVTGLVGAPRLGGDDERRRAKEFPENKVAAEAVGKWTIEIGAIISQGDLEREQEFARRLDALHEIRRFNQIIKTNMERACTNKSTTGDPDDAPAELVRAHRASGLISVQLDALDLLANPASAMSFKPRPWVFYKIVDKIVRIYRVIGDNRNVRIRLSGTSKSDAHLDQRTIHIIPSVFIDNAVKYSESGDTVEVHVCDELRESRPVITLQVTSNGPAVSEAEERNLFHQRGAAMRHAQLRRGVVLG